MHRMLRHISDIGGDWGCGEGGQNAREGGGRCGNTFRPRWAIVEGLAVCQEIVHLRRSELDVCEQSYRDHFKVTHMAPCS